MFFQERPLILYFSTRNASSIINGRNRDSLRHSVAAGPVTQDHDASPAINEDAARHHSGHTQAFGELERHTLIYHREGIYPLWQTAAVLLSLVTIGAGSLYLMIGVGFYGDEWSYTYKAQVFASALKNARSVIDFQEHLSALIGNGWFMPGISVLLSPLYILIPEAPPPFVRCYMLCLNLGLLWILCRQLSRDFGPSAPLLFLGLSTLTPFYILQLSSVFAEIIATHLALIFLLRLSKRLKNEAEPEGALAGFSVGLMTLCRPSGMGLLAIVIAQNVIIALKQGSTHRAIRSSIVATIVAFVTIAPWSTAVSQKFGPTLTITSPAIAGFWVSEDQEYIDRAKTATGLDKKYHAVQTYIWEKSKSSGTTFRDQAKQELQIQGLQNWWWNWLSINTAQDSLLIFTGLKDSNFWTNRYLSSASPTSDVMETFPARLFVFLHTYIWPTLLFVGALIFITPLRPGPAGQGYFCSFHYKAFALLIISQAFFGATHSRYFAQLVPVIACGVTTLFFSSRSAIGVPPESIVRLGQIFSGITGTLLITLALY